MNVSSVSPERCDTTERQPADDASSMAASVSVSVPIWLSLMRIALAAFSLMPRSRNFTLVTNRSSPTSCTRSPSFFCSCFQPSQSSSARPSSIEMIGYFSTQLFQNATMLGRRLATCPCPTSRRRSRPCPSATSPRRPASSGDRHVLARLVAGLLDRLEDDLDRLVVRLQRRREAALVADGGRQPLLVQDAPSASGRSPRTSAAPS